MICSLFIFLMGWVVQGGLSSPLLDLRDGKTAAMQSMSLGKRTTVTRDKGAAQSLEVEERGGLSFFTLPLQPRLRPSPFNNIPTYSELRISGA